MTCTYIHRLLMWCEHLHLALTSRPSTLPVSSWVNLKIPTRNVSFPFFCSLFDIWNSFPLTRDAFMWLSSMDVFIGHRLTMRRLWREHVAHTDEYTGPELHACMYVCSTCKSWNGELTAACRNMFTSGDNRWKRSYKGQTDLSDDSCTTPSKPNAFLHFLITYDDQHNYIM